MTNASSWSGGAEEDGEKYFEVSSGILEGESVSNSEEIPIRI